MSKESQLFDLATTTSNAFGVRSKLAGYEGTKFAPNDLDAHINETAEDYVNSIVNFADALVEDDVDLANRLEGDELEEAQALVQRLKGYDEEELKRIALADWMEREVDLIEDEAAHG